MRYLALMMLCLAALGCSLPVNWPVDISGGNELDLVMAYGEAALEPDLWFVRNTQEAEDRTVVTWESSRYGAIVDFQYLHSNGNVNRAIVRDYISPDAIEILLRAFDRWRETDRCRHENTWMVEFDTHNIGIWYRTRYWAIPTTNTRVMLAVLTFPKSEVEAMDRYAALIFPNFPSCREVA